MRLQTGDLPTPSEPVLFLIAGNVHKSSTGIAGDRGWWTLVQNCPWQLVLRFPKSLIDPEGRQGPRHDYGVGIVSSTFESYKSDFNALIQKGESIREDLEPHFGSRSLSEGSDLIGGLDERYQSWYSESLALIEELFPSRLPEFQSLYSTGGIRDVIASLSYGVPAELDELFEHQLEGIATKQRKIKSFYTQLNILKSVSARFESRLSNLRQLLHADLLDTELGAAKELALKGYLRPAGTLAGVVLESHLAEFCRKRKIKSRKRRPTIGDWIKLLQTTDSIDAVMLQRLKGLNEIRILCSHKKSRDPTADDIEDLISGVERVTRQLL